MGSSADTLLTIRLGRIFREKREKLGLSLRQVEAATGISTSQVNRIENGTLMKPSFVDIINLAAFFHVPTETLAGRSVAPPPEEEADERYLHLSILCQSITKQVEGSDLDALLAILQGFLKYLAAKHLE